jgi:hypothetical protein
MAFAGASGRGVSSVSAAGGAPGATNQRESTTSDAAAGLGGTSSSIATGTSGSASFTLAATKGCGASNSGAGAVVSAVAAGPNESAVNERVTPIANSNANASQMTVCFIAASPKPTEQKSAVSLKPGTALCSFKINLG